MYDRDRQQGVTLIELMIAMVLGLIVLGGVTGVFLANRETYRVSEAVNRMQENARYAFEILGRSIRAAGGNFCGATRVTSVVGDPRNNPSFDRSQFWWTDLGRYGIRGFEGGDTAHESVLSSIGVSRKPGTDALTLISGVAEEGIVISQHQPSKVAPYNSPYFRVATNHNFKPGDLLVACDGDHATVFHYNAPPTAGNENFIQYATSRFGTGQYTNPFNPGNCSEGLGYPTSCDNGDGQRYTFTQGGFLARLTSETWHISMSMLSSRLSLYRMQLWSVAGNATYSKEEVVPNVVDLQLTYLTQTGNTLSSDYVRANEINWSNVANGTTKVVAVRLELTTEEPDVKVGGQPLRRSWYSVVQLRNRASS